MSQNLDKSMRRGYRVFMVNMTKKNGESSLPPPPSPPDPKSAIRFDIKSDEDIVYRSNYKFNADIEILINNSQKTRVAKKNERRGTNKTPRRQNAWILYRRDKSMNPEFEGLKSSIVSLKIREMWQNETDEVKEIFSALSRLAEKRHIERYGKDYKYSPGSKKDQKINKLKPSSSNKQKEKKMYMKLNNCEYFTTTLDYFATNSPECETIVKSSSPSPSNNNNNVVTNSTINFLPSPAEHDVWQDPILKNFKLNDEYSFVNHFHDINRNEPCNEQEINENYETYRIF